MEFRVLAIGDVTSEEGTAHLRRHLPGFKKMKGVDFTVINGENISGTGLTPQQADDLFAAGADVITLGNHTWGKMQITDYLEDNRYILRPANFSPRTPGRGYGVYDLGRVQVAVLCLIGRCDLGQRQPLHHGGPPAEGRGKAHLHPGGFPRPGHQRKAGHGLLSGRPRLRPVGNPHPCAHRR